MPDDCLVYTYTDLWIEIYSSRAFLADFFRGQLGPTHGFCDSTVGLASAEYAVSRQYFHYAHP